MAETKEEAGAEIIGEGTGVKLSLVLTVAGGFLANLLWLTSALGGIREDIQEVSAGTSSNSQQIENLKELVTIQLRVATQTDAEIRTDLKALEGRVRDLEKASR